MLPWDNICSLSITPGSFWGNQDTATAVGDAGPEWDTGIAEGGVGADQHRGTAEGGVWAHWDEGTAAGGQGCSWHWGRGERRKNGLIIFSLHLKFVPIQLNWMASCLYIFKAKPLSCVPIRDVKYGVLLCSSDSLWSCIELSDQQRIKDRQEDYIWLLKVQKPLVVPPCHSCHALSLEQFTGHMSSSNPLGLMEVVPLLLWSPSHWYPDGDFCSFTRDMIELQRSTIPVQDSLCDLRVTDTTTQNVNPMDAPCFQHWWFEEGNPVRVCGQMEVLEDFFHSVYQFCWVWNSGPTVLSDVLFCWIWRLNSTKLVSILKLL